MLTTGLPQLLAKLTQLDGIEAIVSCNPHHGIISVAKRDLIGTLGPSTRRNDNVMDYLYSNPAFSVVNGNGVDQNRNAQPQRQSSNDDERKGDGDFELLSMMPFV